MAEVKGKFITLTANFLKIYPKYYEKAERHVLAKTGLRPDNLDPESWYDARIYSYLMDCYTEASIKKERALIALGKFIYPTIKRTTGFPPGLETPLDYIEFEAQGYLENLRGPEIRPRKITKKSGNHVVVELRMDEQPCTIMEGIYQGILEVTGHTNGTIEQTRCVKNGDPECEFHIKW